MLLMVAMTESMAGVRGYLRELRQSADISQEEFGEVIGLSRRAVIDWETGKTATLKSAQLFRAVAYLKAPIDDVVRLFSDPPLTEDEGRALAARLSPEERREAIAVADALSDEELRHFVAELSEDRELLSPLWGLLRSLRQIRQRNDTNR